MYIMKEAKEHHKQPVEEQAIGIVMCNLCDQMKAIPFFKQKYKRAEWEHILNVWMHGT